MSLEWEERLAAWKEDAERRLRRRWWLWPIVIAVELLRHWAEGTINEFLGTHAGRMYSFLSSLVSSPVAIMLGLSLLVVVGLISHSYYDTRPSRRSVSKIPTVDSSASRKPEIKPAAAPSSGISFAELHGELNKLPIGLRSEALKSYLGMKVEWVAEIITIMSYSLGPKHVMLCTDELPFAVFIAVVDDQPSLIMLRERDKVLVSGVVTSAGDSIMLKPATCRKI